MDQFLILLRALSDRSRLRILELLLCGDLCVGALARRVGLSEGAVSQHLQVLRRAGLIRGEKRGYWTHYAVDRNAVASLAQRIWDLAGQKGQEQGVCSRTLSTLESAPMQRRSDAMCCQDCCQYPEKLKGKPEECTPEQIKECHGDVEKHPCEVTEQRD